MGSVGVGVGTGVVVGILRGALMVSFLLLPVAY